MGWNDFYRRRDALDATLRYAARHPGRPIALTEIPEAREVFRDEGELLLALQHRWNQLLTGQLNLALDNDTEPDQVDAVSDAWLTTAARHRTLRAVLDRHAEDYADTLRPGKEIELRMLAHASGLASPGEQPEQAARVGAAFLGLVSSSPAQQPEPARPCGTVAAHLRRLLAPTG